MSKYSTFHNKDTNKTLIYYPCPKNANTSAKLFFAKHVGVDKNYLFLGDKMPQKYQKKYYFVEKKSLENFLPSKQPFEKRKADFKCCIIRDPIKRFLSAYRNRILYHDDLEFKDHTIDMILEKLENQKFENGHFLPQSYFLGESLDYFSFWSDVEKIEVFEKNVNDFFGKKIKFPNMQKGGSQFNIKLSSKQIKRLRKIYFQDYTLINQ